MKLCAMSVLAAAVVALVGCAKAQPEPPSWVSVQMPLLRKIGIDPTADLVETANYHWSWTSHREVAVGRFHCPPGTSVDVSRSIVVVRTPEPETCRGHGGEIEHMLKVSPDGSAERLGG